MLSPARMYCIVCIVFLVSFFFFFFNDTATTEIYTLSLHDALPISAYFRQHAPRGTWPILNGGELAVLFCFIWLYFSARSEEHTSELQSPCNLVCRLLLEKKKHIHHCHDRRHVPSRIHAGLDVAGEH